MGLEFARQLAAKGFNLLLVSNREEELDSAKAQLTAAWPVRVTVRCQDLARRYPTLTVNVADPGVVASGMIDLGHWFDPLADALFKPFCSSPQKGVQPALRALEATEGPRYYVGEKQKPIPGRYQTPELDQELWEKTEQLIGGFFSPGSC